jgi:hypothetical protein
MTPPTTPEYPEQIEPPEANQNQGQTPPETLPSSLGGGNEEPEPPRQTCPLPKSASEFRRSKHQKITTQKMKEMPNQDLRHRAFVADSDYLGDEQNEDEKGPRDHLDNEAQAHHMLQAFHAASTRNYGHRDDLPPLPKSWKEMMNHPMSAHKEPLPTKR